jgi:hypothetical protein
MIEGAFGGDVDYAILQNSAGRRLKRPAVATAQWSAA